MGRPRAALRPSPELGHAMDRLLPQAAGPDPRPPHRLPATVPGAQGKAHFIFLQIIRQLKCKNKGKREKSPLLVAPTKESEEWPKNRSCY